MNYPLLVKFSPFLIFCLLGAIWISYPKEPGVFPLDDAYIHLTYVRNLATTGTFSFNPGELSTGTSSPLWVGILTPLYWMGLDSYWTVVILCLMLFALLSYLVLIIVRTVAIPFSFAPGVTAAASLTAGSLLVLNGNMVWLALSGMETLLFLVIGLVTILAYVRWGFGFRTGAICGLLMLTHASGTALPAALVLVELLGRKRWTWLKGVIAIVIVVSPYLFFTVSVNGDIFPTTGRAKTLTYVDSDFDLEGAWSFTKAFIAYQRFLPQHIVLAAAIILVALLRLRGVSSDGVARLSVHRSLPFLNLSHLSRPERINSFLVRLYRRLSLIRHQVVAEHLLLTSLVTWGLVHFIMYALAFRILLHHTRYLAIEYVIWTIVGCLALASLQRIKAKVSMGVLFGGVSLALACANTFSWGTLYAENVRHVSDVYVKMADWVKLNTTPDARIAAFDIGVLRYVGDRYVIDLGGVTSLDAHPCLKRRNCGEFLRQSDADYILYSRNPDVDVYNSVYLAEYQGPMLLKQKPLVQFAALQYEAPTLTHSQRLDLYEVMGCFPKTSEGIAKAFAYDHMEFQPLWASVDDSFELVGYWIDHRVVEKIPYHPLFVNFTFFFRANKPLTEPYWVHMALFDKNLDTVYLYEKHRPTHNLLRPHEWPVDHVIKDHHMRVIPDSLPRQQFRIRVTIVAEEELDWDNLGSYKWIDLGGFENRENTIDPIRP